MTLPPIPAGFETVEDEDYIIRSGDLFFQEGRWVETKSSVGKQVKKVLWGVSKHWLTKPDKKRFPTDKPYPFGY